MPLSDLEVQRIMSRSNLEHACTKVFFHCCIRNDGNFCRLQRSADFSTFEPWPAFVLGMDGKGNIAHDCFRTGSGNIEVFARSIRKFITNFKKFSILRFRDYLFVRQSGPANRAPVDHAFPPVNISVIKQTHEGFEHGLGIIRIEGMNGTFPVTGTSEFTQLF